MFKVQFLIALCIIVFAFWCQALWAYQSAEILNEEAPVYGKPNREAGAIALLKQGTKVFVSSKMILGPENTFWYKVKIPKGGFGYIQAQELLTSDLQKDRKNSGVDFKDRQLGSFEDPWQFLIRGMYLGGPNSAFKGFFDGGEAEFSFCIPLREHGYLHRLVSAGLSYFRLSNQSIAMGTAIIRIYTETRIEPEFRLSFGPNVSTSILMGGLSFGLNYPFSLAMGTHLAGYLELGSLLAFKGASSYPIWGAAGLGIHF